MDEMDAQTVLREESQLGLDEAAGAAEADNLQLTTQSVAAGERLLEDAEVLVLRSRADVEQVRLVLQRGRQRRGRDARQIARGVRQYRLARIDAKLRDQVVAG